MSVAKRALRGLLVVPALACGMLVGCGDDDGNEAVSPVDSGVDASKPLVDGAVGIDGSQIVVDAGVDSGTVNPIDAGSAVKGKASAYDISPNGHDRFRGVTYDSAGNILAVGYAAPGTASSDDSEIVVARIKPDGTLDTTFGSGGYARKNVVVGGTSLESGHGIVVTNDGKIVVAGEIDSSGPGAVMDAGAPTGDKDLVLIRFNANGQLDTTFGNGTGVVRHDLGVASASALPDGGVSLSGVDGFGGLSLTPDGSKFLLHASARALTPSADGGVHNDFVLLRLNADGSADTTFAGGRLYTDVGLAGASPKPLTVLANGDIVAPGYTTAALGQNPILYKVKADGTRDNTFATTDATQEPVGVWYDKARSDGKNGEAYGAALVDGKFVTVGYGPSPAADAVKGTTGNPTTDFVFFRFNADGSQDKTFGTNGETFIDIGKYGDNGRGILALPDNRVLAVGVGRPTPAVAPTDPSQAPQDGVIAVITKDGKPDESFGKGGVNLYDFGPRFDEFHGCALSPNKKQVAVVGVGGGTEGTSPNKAVVVLIPLE